jgi:hypothetical protein
MPYFANIQGKQGYFPELLAEDFSALDNESTVLKHLHRRQERDALPLPPLIDLGELLGSLPNKGDISSLDIVGSASILPLDCFQHEKPISDRVFDVPASHGFKMLGLPGFGLISVERELFFEDVKSCIHSGSSHVF